MDHSRSITELLSSELFEIGEKVELLLEKNNQYRVMHLTELLEACKTLFTNRTLKLRYYVMLYVTTSANVEWLTDQVCY